MIQVATRTAELKKLIEINKNKGASIGFVPTMGALHEGHLTLVRSASKENDVVIVSIFVNPTQFNDKKDLEKYPRTLDSDLLLLSGSGANVVFAPGVDDIYPDGDDKGADIDLGGLDMYMEGAFRPGHFKGVAQVVKRLLEIVTPDRLYMGQKDFQQFTIIQYMLDSLKINTQLVVCPIVRETTGLAMSSRNARLSSPTRAAAGIIFRVLKSAKRQSASKTPKEICETAMKKLKSPPFDPEYFIIVDGHTLQPIDDLRSTNYAVACVAVWAEGVRLIDNLIIKKD
jgi:pantoate--beta-alanine ligase